MCLSGGESGVKAVGNTTTVETGTAKAEIKTKVEENEIKESSCETQIMSVNNQSEFIASPKTNTIETNSNKNEIISNSEKTEVSTTLVKTEVVSNVHSTQIAAFAGRHKVFLRCSLPEKQASRLFGKLTHALSGLHIRTCDYADEKNMSAAMKVFRDYGIVRGNETMSFNWAKHFCYDLEEAIDYHGNCSSFWGCGLSDANGQIDIMALADKYGNPMLPGSLPESESTQQIYMIKFIPEGEENPYSIDKE